MTRIAIIGTGYVGLVSAACFAELGHDVTCVDVRPAVVDAINSGKSPIHERDLEPLIVRHANTRLRATTDLAQAIQATEVSFIAVGTPFDGESIDLTQLEHAARSIGEALRTHPSFHVVVVKSTVVPGTTRDHVLPILEEASGKKCSLDFGIAMNPEFLREGEAISDFMRPDRIVLGVEDSRTYFELEQVYAGFAASRLVRTNTKTAEMIKYASNGLFATMISFSNEIANLCSAFGNIDVLDVMRGVHADRRLTPELEDGRQVQPGMLSYLAAGCGFGGSCFPKDVKALVAHGRRHGYSTDLLAAVIGLNGEQPLRLIDLLKRHFPKLRGVRVALLGVAFKSGTDDVRESPAFPVLAQLLAEGAEPRVYDPVARIDPNTMIGGEVLVCASLDAAVEGVDAVLLITAWPEFATLERSFQTLTDPPLLVDGRRMYDCERFARYEGIGR